MFAFIINSLALGFGLTMDAFTVSIANTLREPGMSRRKMMGTSGMYAFFQALMSMTGWFCVHTIVQVFSRFTLFIPWIALCLLCYIGGKMVWEGIKSRKGRKEEDKQEVQVLDLKTLILQAVATSIDALSVGFAIASYSAAKAFAASVIIAAVTFCICFLGCLFGAQAGKKLEGKADIAGGVVLVCIGLEIWLTGIL